MILTQDRVPMTNIEHLRQMKKSWYRIMARHPELQDTPFLNAIDEACNELEQLRAEIAAISERNASKDRELAAFYGLDIPVAGNSE